MTTPRSDVPPPAWPADEGRTPTEESATTTNHLDRIAAPTKTAGIEPCAQSYAALGMQVIPLRRLGNRPHQMLGSGWSRETVGSSDPDQIRSWWATDKWAGVGVINGPLSGVLVIDTDRHRAGVDGGVNLRDWCDGNEVRVANVARVDTPGGGTHYWLRWPEGALFRIATDWLPGVDVPWQVAVPPSPRSIGDELILEYRWVAGDLLALPAAPTALVDAIKPGPGASTTASGDVPVSDVLEPGHRNHQMYRLACRWWRQHWPHTEIVLAKARDVYEVSDTSNFPWTEALRAIESARRFVVPQVQQELAWADNLRSHP